MVFDSQTTRNAMTVARLATIVIAFLFAHDVMMTMSPHHVEAESSHHELVIVEECGSAEGTAPATGGSSFDQSVGNFTPCGVVWEHDAQVSRALDPAFADSDASIRRAQLQVFLN